MPRPKHCRARIARVESSRIFFCLLLPALLCAAPAIAAVPLFVDDAPDAALSLLEIGGDVRMRGYDLENMWDSDSDADADHWSVLRHRTRFFARLEMERGIGAYVRIANQNWGEGVTYGDKWEADNISNKIFVDNAYIDVAGFFDLPADLRIGRQDVFYGSGFVLRDGQSQMASTAGYMDGVRLRIEPAAALDVDLLYFKDQENRRDDAADDDVTLMGAYLTRESGIAKGTEEAYALYREDQNLGKKIWLYGGRVAHAWSNGLDYSLEGGLQRGDFADGIDQQAWGVKTEAGWTFESAPWRPRFFAGFAGLSGDDPATAESERWDVFFGGWPQFGDLMAWTFVNLGPGFNNISVYDPAYAEGSSVGGEAVYSNILIPSVGVETHPTQRLSAKLSWSPVTVQQTDGPDDFGDYYQLGARYSYSRHLTLSLYAALIDPGDAFGPDADVQHEIFWETKLAF